MFCKKCGRMLDDDEQICPFCGENESDKNIQMNIPPENIDANNFAPIKITPYQNMYSDGTVNMGEKSRLTAGLLQLFLGVFGIGRFYLGCTGPAVGQIAVSAVTCGLGGFIWGLIDGVMILNGKVKFDGRGMPLRN